MTCFSYQGYLDCGVFANNPLSAALPLVIGKSPQSLGIPVEDVRVLSLGTGVSYNHIAKVEGEEEGSDWGTSFRVTS